MRKIDLATYMVGEQEFHVRPSLVAVLFNEDRLDPREILRRDTLAQRVESCEDDEILLEDAEWAKINSCLNATDLKPLGRSVAEFIRRVVDAPKVDVQERP